MRHALEIPVPVLALALPAAGCVTDSASAVLIIHNQAPGVNCSTSASLSDPFLGRGFIDAQSPFPYLFTPLVKNEAVSVMGQPESQRIAFLQGATVDLNFEDGLLDASTIADLQDRGLVNFTVDFTGTVLPDDGLTSVQFPILPVELLVELQAVLPNGNNPFTLVRADVSLFGELGGGDFQTRTFSYPIDVCDRCLIVSLGACSELPAGFVSQTGGECNALQDPPEAAVECCSDVTGDLVCPARALAPAL